MRQFNLKKPVRPELLNRLRPASDLPETRPLNLVSTGIPEIDAITGGIPRGSIVEITGARSSGKTTLMTLLLAEASSRGEACALVDAGNSFDPVSASEAGIDLSRLLWVRCSRKLEASLRAADFIVQGGGFGFIALDLADFSFPYGCNIPSSFWFRFCRSVENTPTRLVVIARAPLAVSCAAISLKVELCDNHWTPASNCFPLLEKISIEAERKKPIFLKARKHRTRLEAKASWF